MSNSVPPLPDALRIATRPVHEEIEAIVDPEKRFVDEANYVAVLDLFRRFYVNAESAIIACLGTEHKLLSDFPQDRSERLRADLEFFGKASSEALCESVVQPKTVGEALGVMYVFEGASLGGQIVSRFLQNRLGLRPGPGLLFFGSGHYEAGPRWRQFKAELDEHEHERDEVISAACDTFVYFRDWVSKGLNR